MRVEAFSPSSKRQPGNPGEFHNLQQFAAAALSPLVARPKVVALLSLLENFDPEYH